MKIIIPVAGMGTRLLPITKDIPKCLIPLLGKPILGHVLERCAILHPSEIIIVYSNFGEQIKKYASTYKQHTFRFVKQKELCGLAHALFLASKYVDHEEPVFIALGDILFDIDFSILEKEQNIIWVKQVSNPSLFGVVTLEKGKLVGIEEKPKEPKSDLAIIGAYYFKRSGDIFSEIVNIMKAGKGNQKEYLFTDAMSNMIHTHQSFSIHHAKEWLDCGTFGTLLATHQELLKKKKTRSTIEGLQDPVFMEERVKITNSTIGPYVTLGKGSVIANCVLKNCILIGKNILKDATISDCVVYKSKCI
jgi:glucose-1-phosphate thymidylyltransferase